jgi:hypothetical protein
MNLLIIDKFADNGQFSHNELIDTDSGMVLWSSDPDTSIRAKALRKKGTDKFYGFHAGEEKWMIMKWFPVYLGRTLKMHFTRLEPDAELVDIEIRIIDKP